MLEHNAFWRRLDTTGYDKCTLLEADGGCRLTGTAVFYELGQPCRLNYDVVCDPSWRARFASVRGWVGGTVLDLAIESLPGNRWKFKGVEVPEVTGMLDIDLGFTPATNLTQLRRLNLEVGQSADAPVAYLYFPELKLGRVRQRYERLGPDTYHYHSPSFGYAAILEVSEVGFVRKYPGLWEMEEEAKKEKGKSQKEKGKRQKAKVKGKSKAL